MGATITLAPEDREFFGWVAAAAFANPFGNERMALDRRIANAETSFADETERVARIQGAVTERMRRLTGGERPALRHFRRADHELIWHVFLFESYHRVLEKLDTHIVAQVRAGDVPVAVPGAAATIEELVRAGFSREDAGRYFAIFFQIRRAYYFIWQGLVGESPCMQRLRERLWDTVFTHDIRRYDQYLWNRMEDFSTLLLGETGTGKGASAAAIGRSGYIPFDERKGTFTESFQRSFVALNLSQFPEALIESELFGHCKGAFTGAVAAHEGVFARCSAHGSIFLDEIGEVNIPIQIKLLQVLQERTFSPVGSHEARRFRGRVIAATNRPLEMLRTQKLFRDDFFYRLCSDIVTVPPLRQRLAEAPGELERLVEHLLARLTGQSEPGLVAFVLEVLGRDVAASYSWPGNVRELEQAIRRILLTRHYQGDARPETPDMASVLRSGIEAGTLDADGLLAGYCRLLHGRHGTIEEVARRTNLDRRTVKRYLGMSA
jgi:DNA-binding NtrC family response regulator